MTKFDISSLFVLNDCDMNNLNKFMKIESNLYFYLFINL